jgi:O-antigen/teichoic acid export membrane protein
LSTLKKISSLNKLLAGSAGIFAFGLGLSFIFNWGITKIMHQEEVGVFQYYNAIITLGMVVIPFGYQSLIQREASKLNKVSLKQYNLQTFLTIAIGSICFGSIWSYGVLNLNWVNGLNDFKGLAIALCLLPVYAVLTYYRALLQGQNKVYWSILPEVVFRPLTLLIVCFVFYAISYETKAYHLLLTLLITLGILIIPSAIQSKKNLSSNTQKEDKPQWLKQAMALLPIGLLYTINERIDVVMISKNLSAEDIAVYIIAYKFAAFSAFGLVIINSVMVPLIAKHFNSREPAEKLEALLKPNIRKALLLSTIISIVLIVFGKHLLSFFGKDTENYTTGYFSMIVLIVGQLANVAVGSVGYVLTMAKLEKLAMVSMGVSIVINIILNYLLLPIYGIEGVAISTALGMLVWNVLMLVFVKRKTGLNPTVF